MIEGINSYRTRICNYYYVTAPKLRYDAGAELQFLTPIWNILFRVGYGFNLDPVFDESRVRFFFTLAVRF